MRLRTLTFIWALLGLMPAPSLLGADNHLTPAEQAAGWLLLFDGQTLNGWKTSGMQESRTPVEEGAINPHGCGHYMMIHERVWADFILSLDFKISKGCNSGVFLRTWPLDPLPGWDVGYNGIEVAIDDTTTADYHDTGAIYDLAKPARNAMRPVGEWNRMVVTCFGPLITVVVNGDLVTAMNLDGFGAPHARPDGTEHKFEFAYKDKPRFGYIGLQDHGSPCWHKNIKLLPLDRPVAELSRESPAHKSGIWDETGREWILKLTASAPSSDWSKPGAEAPYLGVYMHGRLQSHLPIHMGREPHEYSVMLGRAGEWCDLEIKLLPELSSPGSMPEPPRPAVVIHKIDFKDLREDDALNPAVHNAPILYSRPGARFTDIPLLAACEKRRDGPDTRLGYTYVFSNEDGGTKREALMATYGRMTDIEGLYQATAKDGGGRRDAKYQGMLHQEREFNGQFEGAHPILYISTPNNMASPRGTSELRFALAPEAEPPREGTRERLMDAAPWTYAVMAREWMREGREAPTDPLTPTPGDARDFLYLEFKISAYPDRGAPAPRGSLAWAAQIEGDERWFWSDHGDPKLRVGGAGWSRAAIELPPGTPVSKIARLKVKIFPDEAKGPATPSALCLDALHRSFMLGSDWRLRPSRIEMHESDGVKDPPRGLIDTDPATAAPEELILDHKLGR